MVPSPSSLVKIFQQAGISQEQLLALRAETDANIGVNFDASQLFWQGVSMPHVIQALGDAIFHFHAKDTKINPIVADVKGVFDTKSYREYAQRSWISHTVGYGHGAESWRDIVSALRLAGYDGVLSIEDEDGLMSAKEGFEKAVHFLRAAVIRQEVGRPFWP